MSRPSQRASSAQLNRIHKLVAKAIERELADSLKKKEPVSTALVGKALDLLKLTETRDPQKEKPKGDSLADMPDFDDDYEPPKVKPQAQPHARPLGDRGG